MSNALAAFVEGKGKDLQVSNEQMADALSTAVHDSTTGDGAGVTYLNFSGKSGQYALGRDKDDVDPEEVFIIEPMTVFRGWQCWKNNKPVEKSKWSVFSSQAAVAEEDLPDHGPYRQSEGWKAMLGFGCIDAESGQQIEFSTDSVSGRNAVGQLLDEIAQRARAGENTIPVVHFDREQFVAQEQTNWKPKLVVEAWVAREQVAALMAEDVKYSVDDLMAGKKLTAAQKKKLQ